MAAPASCRSSRSDDRPVDGQSAQDGDHGVVRAGVAGGRGPRAVAARPRPGPKSGTRDTQAASWSRTTAPSASRARREAGRSASTTGWRNSDRSAGWHRPRRTWPPVAAHHSATASRSRVLPMPPSPRRAPARRHLRRRRAPPSRSSARRGAVATDEGVRSWRAGLGAASSWSAASASRSSETCRSAVARSGSVPRSSRRVGPGRRTPPGQRRPVRRRRGPASGSRTARSSYGSAATLRRDPDRAAGSARRGERLGERCRAAAQAVDLAAHASTQSASSSSSRAGWLPSSSSAEAAAATASAGSPAAAGPRPRR